MSFEEYFRVVTNSTRSDWNVILCWGSGSGPSYRDQLIVWTSGQSDFRNLEVKSHSLVAVYKPDLTISMAFGLESNDEFVEPWANRFPDPNASSHYIDFFFGSNLIHRGLYVSVDGGRADLPLPRPHYSKIDHKLERVTITTKQDSFFRLFNQFEAQKDYDSYRERAGFEIEEGAWPRADV
jgi:hypothetical protein